MRRPSELDVLVAAGELRPGLMHLLSASDDNSVLLGAPGLIAGPANAALANEPWRSFSVQRSAEQWALLLRSFQQLVDTLPQNPEWEQRISAWLLAMSDKRMRFAFWAKAPLFSRILSKPKSTLVLSEPLHERLDAVSHELRLELSAAEHERARAWFGDRFSEATDVTEAIADCLRRSWAGELLDPADAYYKVLAEYFAATLQGLDTDVDDNPLLENLTEFQQEAYHYAKGILNRFGGVFLADVVGLGKTFIAMALLSHLQRRYGEHAVVIAPPKVLPAWEELAKEFRVEVAFVSHGKLSDLDQFSDREVLVIDESHNFRHVATDRYAKVASWLRPDGAPSHRKVLLLTATPQNSDPLDIKHQVQLFPDNYTRLPYLGESLDAWFKGVRAGGSQLRDLLQHIIVRRTRGYIRRAFPDATLRKRLAPGRYQEVPLVFPQRLSGADQCLRYSIADTYHGGVYEQVLATLAALRFPLYGLGAYILEQHAEDPRLRGQRRAGTSIRGLYKVLLLKRLESSVHAFRATLAGLIRRLEHARDLFKAGRVLVNAKRSAEEISENDDDDRELDVFAEVFEVPASLFSAQLGRDIVEDLSRVSAVEAMIKNLGPDEDAKLARLRRYLTARSPEHHRTIIFTQFADTAEYLGRALENHHGRTEVVSGRVGGALTAARRFAPKANRVNVPEEDQIDLLISTDMLSEGVNLQDADTLINYDLHWNPVRLIQRAGRIDRIGSEHSEIHVASFLPERQLEAGLGLEEVLRRRIAEFVAVFGEDGQVLPGGERLELSDIADAYSGKALNGADESDLFDGLSRHVDRILTLRRTDPERFARIVGIRPGRRSATNRAGKSVAATRLGVFWSFWDVDGQPLREMDTVSGLDRFFLHAESAARDITPEETVKQLSMLQQVRETFEPAARTVRAQRSQPRLSGAESYVLSQLETYLSTCLETRKPLVREIIEWLRSGQAQSVLARRAKLWKREQLGAELVFTECRGLFAQLPKRAEELGDAEVVAASFGTPL